MMSVQACGATMAGSYFTSDKENYYTRDQSALDQWQGRLCKKIGLEDGAAVKAEDFQTVLDARSSGCVGYDCTFSAPKSVSILSQIGNDQQRADMLGAHRDAVADTLKDMEQNAIFARTKKNGITTRHQTHNAAIAKFEHNLSRANDPQIHTHCFFSNNTEYQGKLYAIDGQELYKLQKIYGAEYRARLAENLRARGYDVVITDPEKGFFELKGMESREDLEIFSKRRAEIVRELEARGESGAEAAQRATLRTRGAKQHADTEELREQWREAWGERPLAERAAEPLPEIDRNAAQMEAYKAAVSELESQNYAWTEKQFEEAITTRGVDCGITRERARELIANDPDILRGELKIRTEAEPEQYFSTVHNVETEAGLFQSLADGRGNFRAALDAETTTREIDAIEKENGWKLTEQQRSLVEHIATSKDEIIGVRGLAGTGKSFSLNATREVLERQGYEVIGAAPSGQAAQELAQDAHLKECGTLQHIMNKAEKEAGNAIPGEDYTKKKTWNFENIQAPAKPRVYFIDEAGMMNNDTARELFKMAEAERAAGGDVKICLVGDDRQLPPIGAGNFFSDAIQRGAIDYCEMTDIQRQKNAPELLRAVEESVKGSPEKALHLLADENAIHEIKTARGRVSAITKEYMSMTPAERENTLILTARNADRKQINDAIREARIKRGEIENGQEFKVEINGKETVREFSKGDRIILLQNDGRAVVMNGNSGTIEKINGSKISIKLDGKEARIVELDTAKYNKIDHAYAVTTHKAQGATVDRVIINMNSSDKALNSRNAFYVDISRARNKVSLYCDNKAKCGKQIKNFAKKLTSKDFIFHPTTGRFSRVPGAAARGAGKIVRSVGKAARGAVQGMTALVPPIPIIKPLAQIVGKVAETGIKIAEIGAKVVEQAASLGKSAIETAAGAAARGGETPRAKPQRQQEYERER